MLMVRTALKPSAIHGLGLFTLDDIQPLEVIWSFDERFDRYFTLQELKALPSAATASLFKYGYFSKRSGKFILDSDDARFINHADHPNTKLIAVDWCDEDQIVASEFIAAGTEITVSYDDHADLKKERKEFPLSAGTNTLSP